jgi:hypothetical protein
VKSRYRLYIDESGDHTFHEIQEESRRYLGLIGCIIEGGKYRTDFFPELEKLKQKHFPHNPDEPVILHRSDIINRRGPFWRLREPENEKAFNRDLLYFFENQEYTVIAAVIDKKTHIERYQEAAFHPYHYCLAALLERYCGWLHFYNSEGDVMAESRGGTEDRQLKAAYKRTYYDGTQFRGFPFFQSVLTSKEIKLKSKKFNIAGLQISDLLAYPVKQEILVEKKKILAIKDNFGQEICNVINKKYNRHFYNGRIDGYGKVFLK